MAWNWAIPTINTNHYSFIGAELKYRRLYSVYLNLCLLTRCAQTLF